MLFQPLEGPSSIISAKLELSIFDYRFCSAPNRPADAMTQPEGVVLPAVTALEQDAEDDDDEPKTVTSKRHSKTRLKRSTVLAPPSPFKPAWKDYDVMRNRWRYIQPFTNQLYTHDIEIPRNGTDRWVKPQTVPVAIFGNIADATYFDRIISPEKRRNSELSPIPSGRSNDEHRSGT